MTDNALANRHSHAFRDVVAELDARPPGARPPVGVIDDVVPTMRPEVRRGNRRA